MSDLPNVVFVLGAPGSGKGTLCNRIVNEFDFVHLSAGELLRTEMKQNPQLEKEYNQHVQNGTNFPVHVPLGLLKRAIVENHTKYQKANFLIDGFPPNQENLDGWNEAMSANVNLKFILFLNVPVEMALERALKRQRFGDKAESIKKRIETYEKTVLPIVEYYKARDLVKMVDGTPDQDIVFEEVKKLFM